jgi:hypothetical protein
MVFGSTWFGSLNACQQHIFKGVVHLSGIFDLTPLVPTTINMALKMDQKEAEENSPLLNTTHMANNFHMKRQDFAILVIVGEYDSPAFISQGQDYASKVSLLYLQLRHELSILSSSSKLNIVL